MERNFQSLITPTCVDNNLGQSRLVWVSRSFNAHPCVEAPQSQTDSYTPTISNTPLQHSLACAYCPGDMIRVNGQQRVSCRIFKEIHSQRMEADRDPRYNERSCRPGDSRPGHDVGKILPCIFTGGQAPGAGGP